MPQQSSVSSKKVQASIIAEAVDEICRDLKTTVRMKSGADTHVEIVKCFKVMPWNFYAFDWFSHYCLPPCCCCRAAVTPIREPTRNLYVDAAGVIVLAGV